MNFQQLHDRLVLLEKAVFGDGKTAASASSETPLQKAIREAKEKSK